MNQKDIETLAIALPEDILKAKWCGDFNRAFHLIDLYLANEKVPAFMKTRLALEREVLKALPTGYTYSEEDALALVQKEIPDFTKAELDALRDRGAIDWIYINGKTTYSRTFYDTLLGVYPDIATRAGKPPKDKSDRVEFLRQNVRDMKKDGDALWSIQLRAQFRLHDDVFRPGEELTVHLPVPKNAMNMRDIEILATSHPIYKLADENAPARTVSFRGKFEKNETFWVEYKYLSYVKYNNLESAQVSAERRRSTPRSFTRTFASRRSSVRFAKSFPAMRRTRFCSHAAFTTTARRSVHIRMCANTSRCRAAFRIITARGCTGTAACRRCCSSRCAAAQVFLPVGRAACSSRRTTPAATTGRSSTLLPTAGCLQTRPSAAVRTAWATASAMTSTSAISTRSAWRQTASFRRILTRQRHSCASTRSTTSAAKPNMQMSASAGWTRSATGRPSK